MEPIELEPVTVSDKEVVYRQLEANVAKTGVPRAIIDDHGGDLAGGVELFCQAHPETIDDLRHQPQGRVPAESAIGTRRTVEGVRGEGRSNQMQHSTNGMGVSDSAEPADRRRAT